MGFSRTGRLHANARRFSANATGGTATALAYKRHAIAFAVQARPNPLVQARWRCQDRGMRFLTRLTLVALWCATTAHAGTAIVIGGALKNDNEAVWARIVEEAGGAGAPIAVFATAAANPER